MAKRTKLQEDALKALSNPKVIAEYDDGSIDFMFEGSKLAMGPNGVAMSPSEYMKQVYTPWKEKKKPESTLAWTGYQAGTPCEREPELCKPRVIKHVAWDADDTIWDIRPYGIASNITGKLTLIDPDTVIEEREPYKPYVSKKETSFQPSLDEGLRYKHGYKSSFSAKEEPEDFFLKQMGGQTSKYETEASPEAALEVGEIMTVLTEELTQKEKDALGLIGQDVKLIPFSATPPKEPKKKKPTTYVSPKLTIKLMPGYRDLLDTLKKQGVTNSIISLNTKGTVSRILEKFGIADHYLDIRDSWDSKGKVFNEQMKNFGYKPQEAMFVDNMQSHVEEVAKSGAIPLVYGKDIKEVAQIVNYMTND